MPLGVRFLDNSWTVTPEPLMSGPFWAVPLDAENSTTAAIGELEGSVDEEGVDTGDDGTGVAEPVETDGDAGCPLMAVGASVPEEPAPPQAARTARQTPATDRRIVLITVMAGTPIKRPGRKTAGLTTCLNIDPESASHGTGSQRSGRHPTESVKVSLDDPDTIKRSQTARIGRNWMGLPHGEPTG